jgi:hypothetical protein
MKRQKLKPGKIWALRLSEKGAAQIVLADNDGLALTFKTKKGAIRYQSNFPAWDRPELVELWVEER